MVPIPLLNEDEPKYFGGFTANVGTEGATERHFPGDVLEIFGIPGAKIVQEMIKSIHTYLIAVRTGSTE
jgi:hypothetical protein